MDIDNPGQRAFLYLAGMALGVAICGPLGPALFSDLALNVRWPTPARAAVGCAVGAALGYAAARAYLAIARHQRERDLEANANAVLANEGLPSSIQAEARDRSLILYGEVDDADQSRHAEQTLLLVPGVRRVTNQLRLRPTAPPDAQEIREQIREGLRKIAQAEGDGIRIHVRDQSKVVLEGTVNSIFESAEVEEIVWNLPGVAEVENRLEYPV